MVKTSNLIIFVVPKRSMKKLSITILYSGPRMPHIPSSILIYFLPLLPGENCHAQPKKSFVLKLTALYSLGVQIFLSQKTKNKMILAFGFFAAQ